MTLVLRTIAAWISPAKRTAIVVATNKGESVEMVLLGLVDLIAKTYPP